MTKSHTLLERIESALNHHGGDLGGWTRLDGEQLQIFDGRVTLRAEVQEPRDESDRIVHGHVFATLHEHDDEVLDACVMGMGTDRDHGLSETALRWMSGVAGPIRSFLDNKPVCMTCQAGVADGNSAEGYVAGDYGLPGMRAFVGPAFVYMADGQGDDVARIDDTKPWFRFAAEAAAPRRVHLAKATCAAQGKAGWSRQLEIDGHDVSHHEPVWPVGVPAPSAGYVTRYAVFEFPRNSTELKRREKLERTILAFAEQYPKHESVDEMMAGLERAGHDPNLLHEVESISTIAFGRYFFRHQPIAYPPVVIRARADGRVEEDVPLMSVPAFTRGMALAVKLEETIPRNDFQSLCLYNAESHAICQMLTDSKGPVDFTKLRMHPSVVPDRECSTETMDRAVAIVMARVEKNRPTKKPWWKIW
jgi:hypothetical protein